MASNICPRIKTGSSRCSAMAENIALVILIAFVVGIALLELYLLFSMTEYIWCVFHNQIPFVASARPLRRAVVDAINKYYPNATSIVDIGAGYGGLARHIARNCDATVVALENMPFTITVSRVFNSITRSRVQIIKCDAFEYLKSSPRFDIGIAYLGPNVNPRLIKYTKQFNMLITLDVPIAGLHPVHTVNVGHGFTRYGRHKFPHKLFIYDFRK